MHHKKRIQKNFNPSRKYNINHYQVNRLERFHGNVFFLFTLAIITSLIFLYAYSPITGNAVLSSQLSKEAYDAGEKITGIVSLQIQEGDILPENSKISIIISGNQTKCQTKYVCSVSGEVDWYRVNVSSGECYLKNADPEALCCNLNSLNCNQIIKNSGFENELDSWVFSRTGHISASGASEKLTLLDETDDSTIYDSMTAKLSTEGISQDASARLTQTFATPIVVGNLIGLTMDKPNIIISEITSAQENFELVYNITVCNFGYVKTTRNFIVQFLNENLLSHTATSKSYRIDQNLSVGQCILNTTRIYEESGDYTLKVKADYSVGSLVNGYINEINESDNTKNITINNYYVRDLYFGINNSINNITYIPSTTTQPPKVNYTIQVCNDYNASLGPFNVSIYSPNSTYNNWSENEPIISTAISTYIQFPSISQGACLKQIGIYSVGTPNANLPNETYYYWIWIDKDNRINDRPSDNKLWDSFDVGTTGGDEPNIRSELSSAINEEEQVENILLFDTTLYGTSTDNFSLGWMAYANADYYGGCAFDIIVHGKHLNADRRLHYYYKISDICSVPENNITDVYFSSDYDYTRGLIDAYTDLHSNWISAYGVDGETDTLTGISIVSLGKVSSSNTYSQSVYFDNIRLDKTSNLQPVEEMSCEARDKVCCLEGAGSGIYYGEQLSCSEGYGCWEKCSQKEFTLKQFIANSSTSTKYNKTEGICQVQTDSNPIDLVDSCAGDYSGCDDCVGEGYTACIDTSSTSKTSCKSWDNIYSVNLSKLNIYAPSSNGTYSVKLLFTYKTTEESLGEIIEISTLELPLIVGAGEPIVVPTCLDSQYVNCTGTWSQCDTYNTKTRTALCYYSGTEACPTTRSLTQTEQCYISSNVTTCTEYDWDCGDWSTCEGGSQIRTCNLIGTSCDPTMYGSYVPEQQQGCNEPIPEGTGFNIKYLIYGLIGIGLLVGIFFLIKFLMSHEGKKEMTYQSIESLKTGREKEKIEKTEKKIENKEEYPELNSYIKDALAAGMNPSEIRLKLQEAGWPKNIIDAVFKKFE